MLTALTRKVSPRISECELTYRDRVPIDFERAAAQHAMYEETLKSLGVRVTALPSTPDLPDAAFVEDTAVVLDNAAVIGSPLPSRRAELESVSSILGAHRELRFITGNGRLEGGDILVVDRTIFAGISTRTNQEGIRQLTGHAEPLGYSRPSHASYRLPSPQNRLHLHRKQHPARQLRLVPGRHCQWAI